MPFRNEEHKAAFETAVKKTDKNKHSLMSALYLLTANRKLWEIMKQHTEKNGILFDNVKLGTISEKALHPVLCRQRPVSRHKATVSMRPCR